MSSCAPSSKKDVSCCICGLECCHSTRWRASLLSCTIRGWACENCYEAMMIPASKCQKPDAELPVGPTEMVRGGGDKEPRARRRRGVTELLDWNGNTIVWYVEDCSKKTGRPIIRIVKVRRGVRVSTLGGHVLRVHVFRDENFVLECHFEPGTRVE